MNKKATAIRIIAIIIAVPTLLFGVYLYEQITGQTIYPTRSISDTYTLQKGEFPYCIARRFDVDPDQLFSINELSPEMTTLPSPLTLIIPSNSSFPGNRTLQKHPTVYNVPIDNMSIYEVACNFGDVFPEEIAELNNLSVNSLLYAGQIINIP
jgi:hypothetical protein